MAAQHCTHNGNAAVARYKCGKSVVMRFLAARPGSCEVLLSSSALLYMLHSLRMRLGTFAIVPVLRSAGPCLLSLS